MITKQLKRTFMKRGSVDSFSTSDESDYSFSSTHTAHRGPLKRRFSSSGTFQLPRRVTFDESRNTFHSNPATKEEMKEQCYQTADFMFFKKATKTLAKELIKRDADTVASMPSSYASVTDGVYKACRTCSNELAFSLEPSQRKQFRAWVQGSVTRLGLEHMTIEFIHQDKALRRDMIFQKMEKIQKGVRNDEVLREGMIRAASESLSRTSRLFAREMGSACAP